jgi:hypothetical protein
MGRFQAPSRSIAPPEAGCKGVRTPLCSKPPLPRACWPALESLQQTADIPAPIHTAASPTGLWRRGPYAPLNRALRRLPRHPLPGVPAGDTSMSGKLAVALTARHPIWDNEYGFQANRTRLLRVRRIYGLISTLLTDWGRCIKRRFSWYRCQTPRPWR